MKGVQGGDSGAVSWGLGPHSPSILGIGPGTDGAVGVQERNGHPRWCPSYPSSGSRGSLTNINSWAPFVGILLLEGLGESPRISALYKCKCYCFLGSLSACPRTAVNLVHCGINERKQRVRGGAGLDWIPMNCPVTCLLHHRGQSLVSVSPDPHLSKENPDTVVTALTRRALLGLCDSVWMQNSHLCRQLPPAVLCGCVTGCSCSRLS